MKAIHDEEKETPEQEAEESPEQEAAEQATGNEGVTVSEDYQKRAHGVTHKASKHELSHLRSKMDDRQNEIYREEEEARSKGKTKNAKMSPVSEFSEEDMPKD